MFTNRWLDKEIVVYSYNEIISSDKNKQITDTHNNIEESQKSYAK